MTEEDLISIGITSYGAKTILLEAIKGNFFFFIFSQLGLSLLHIGFALTATLQTLMAVSNVFTAGETEDLLKKKKTYSKRSKRQISRIKYSMQQQLCRFPFLQL